MLAQWQLQVLVRTRQRVGVQLTLGEALHGGAGVAEQQAAGAMAVQQFAYQAGAGVIIAAVYGIEQLAALFAEETADGVAGLGAELALVEQLLHGLGNRRYWLLSARKASRSWKRAGSSRRRRAK